MESKNMAYNWTYNVTLVDKLHEKLDIFLVLEIVHILVASLLQLSPQDGGRFFGHTQHPF
jgi:hypothetical protein